MNSLGKLMNYFECFSKGSNGKQLPSYQKPGKNSKKNQNYETFHK